MSWQHIYIMYRQDRSRIIHVTKVTKGSSQQTFKLPNNNSFDVRFEKADQNHNNEILHITDQKREYL